MTWSSSVSTTDWFLAHDTSVTDKVLFRAIKPTDLRNTIGAATASHTHSNYLPFTNNGTKTNCNDVTGTSFLYCGTGGPTTSSDGVLLTHYYNSLYRIQFYANWYNADGNPYVRTSNNSSTFGSWCKILTGGHNDPVKMTSTTSNPSANGASRFFYYTISTASKASVDSGF